MEPTNRQQPKTNDFVILLLSSLLILSCLVAGFFAYKTQNLVKEITKLKSVPTQIASATPTPDPTADWKTYTNEKYGFEFKYPESINTKNKITNDIFDLYMNGEEQNRVIISINQIKTFQTEPLEWWNTQKIDVYSKLPSSCFDLTKEATIISNHNAGTVVKQFDKEITIGKSKDTKGCGVWPYNITFLLIPNSQGILKITYEAGYSIQSEDILSTFRFIEPDASSTPLPVACTMEAKVCPDGSYVGRSGPKCEFAACPTTSPQP